MPQIRLCSCGVPAVYGPWCWVCSREHERRHVPLPTIVWNDPRDFD